MFAHLRGVIDGIHEDHLVMDVQGVGYLVFASRLTLANISMGAPVKLHIETLMRQESLQLFGFLTREEFVWFRLLLTVQGIGPKVALGILGSLGLPDLFRAVTHQDKSVLSRAVGVGPKLAGRLLLELKDKLRDAPVPGESLDHTLGDPVESLRILSDGVLSSVMEDARSALMNLGYSRLEVLSAMKGMDPSVYTDPATVIRMALQTIQSPKLSHGEEG